MPPKSSKRRGHTPGRPLSEAELAARRANLAKAHPAPKERTYRPTAKRQAASRANLQKAIAARRRPEVMARTRLNALKHGLFASLGPSMERLGEDSKEFAPEDDVERAYVERLAGAVWRRFRLHAAQARRERDRLAKGFRVALRPGPVEAEDLHLRAIVLVGMLNDFKSFFQEAAKLESRVEYWLRKLISKRSGGAIKFKGIVRRHDPAIERLEKDLDLSYAPVARFLPPELATLWKPERKK